MPVPGEPRSSQVLRIHSVRTLRNSYRIRTFLCKLGELLDFGDLGATLFFVKTLECILEEVRVRSETRIFWNAVVVLTDCTMRRRA